MSDSMHSTFLRRKLGGKLRRMREAAGLTLDQAAPKLDKKKSALHRLEIGVTRVSVHLLRTMMDVYDHYEPALLDEAREANKKPWYQVFGIKNAAFFDVETEASQLSQFLLVEIPGLLQTQAYMQELFRAHHQPVPIEQSTQARLFRQHRLTSDERPLQLHSVVHEAALRRRFDDPEVMREQLRHLIEMAELPTVTLQVRPSASTSYLPDSPFTLLDFPDPDDQSLLYIEYPTGSLQTEDPVQVQQAKLIIEQLRITALNPTDSVAFIEELVRSQ